MESTNSPSPNFFVDRLEHDTTGEDFIRISFERTGGRPRGTLIDKVSVISNPKRRHELLLDAGADLPLRGLSGDEVDPMTSIGEKVGLLCTSPGWTGNLPSSWFVFADVSVGEVGRLSFLDKEVAGNCLSRGTSGDLTTWKKLVASLAVQSPVVTATMLVAFAAPLLKFSKLKEAFIFNIVGNGSSGKTSANLAAASVWGDPNKVASWNASPRGLIESAAANNDMCLVLDDVEQAHEDPKLRHPKVHNLTHDLVSGTGRIYSKVVSGSDQLPKLKFRTLVLSSSPYSIEEVLRANGSARTDGDRARLLEYLVPHGDVGGIWLGADGRKVESDTAALSDRLVAACRANFGVAGRAFIDYLANNQKDMSALVEKYQEKFLSHLDPALGSVQRRIAEKVALLYAAGRIAMKADVAIWKKEQLLATALSLFHKIIRASNLTTFDPATLVQGLCAVFSDATRFPRLADENTKNYEFPGEGAGFVDKNSGRIYARLSSFRDIMEAVNGKPVSSAHQAELFDFLRKNKALLVGEGGSPTRTVTLKSGKPKLLVFTISALAKLVDPNREKPAA